MLQKQKSAPAIEANALSICNQT